MRWLLIAAAVVLAGCASQPLAPHDLAAVEAARQWVMANTRYRDLPMPRVAFAPSAFLVSVTSDANAFGAYQCPQQHLRVRDGLDLSSVFGQTTLVHELTHHGQCIDGRMTRNCEREMEAYSIGKMYLQQQPATPYRDRLIAASDTDIATWRCPS